VFVPQVFVENKRIFCLKQNLAMALTWADDELPGKWRSQRQLAKPK
jgi:hypothetical protein